MKFDDVHVVGIGTALGERRPADERDDTAGQCDETQPDRVTASVSSLSGPQLAALASQRALADSARWMDQQYLSVDLHLHATIWDPAIDFWSAPCFVRPPTIRTGRGLSVGLGGMSNSCVGGIDLASRVLASGWDMQTAVISAGDAFPAPSFCRWSSDDGIVYGDAGAGVVLGCRPGWARVLSSASWTDAALEGLHRGSEPHHRQRRSLASPIDIRGRKAAWRAENPGVSVTERNAAAVRAVVRSALDDADLSLDEITVICTPFYGPRLAERHLLAPLGIPVQRTSLFLAPELGHLGASDQLVALWHLLHSGALRAGQCVLLLGIGVGMTWTAVALHITALPQPGHAAAHGADARHRRLVAVPG